MNTQDAIEKLFHQLSELSKALAQLGTTLQQEQSALVDNDFAALEKLAHEKEQLSNQIETLEQQRRHLCQQLQIECDYDGIRVFIAGLSSKLLARFEQAWEKISDLGHECASQNQVNGILVANQHRHAQEALAVLRGIEGNNELYSASGSQQNADVQHSLGRV